MSPMSAILEVAFTICHFIRVTTEVKLEAGSRTISDYSQLVYVADRHHWNERFWVLLDEPLGDAHGVGFYQQFTGSGEPVYRAVLLDEVLETLQELEGILVSRNP